MRSKLRNVGTITGAAALAAGAAWAGMNLLGVAHADSNTDQFLADIHAQGIYGIDNGDAGVIANGVLVCNKLAAGETPLAVAGEVYVNTSLSAYTSGYFVGLAIKDLCPQFAGELPRENRRQI